MFYRLNTVAVCLVFLLTFFVALPGLAIAEETREYQIKAAFVFNILKHVEWPQGSGDLKLGVYGANPFGGSLQALEGRSIGSRRLLVSFPRQLEDLDELDVVFVAQSETTWAASVLSQVKSKPILTISDIPDFVGLGGAIGFVTLQNRLKFELGQSALQQAGLKASPELQQEAVKLR